MDTYRVSLEPLNEEFECGDDETVLEAAFRNGYNLVHGCREGRCTACKSFLQDGYVWHKPYSTFALSESEEEEGFTLLCRAVPESDVVVELLTYDPDQIRLENPVVEGRARVLAIEALTHDISRLTLGVEEPDPFAFKPGQYVDLGIPGTDRRRAYSMANLPDDGELEFIIRRYPGGAFSALLDGELRPGDELTFQGPFGTCCLSGGGRAERCVLIAGGSGMAPMLSLLRQIATQGATAPVRFFYGARAARDLFYLEVIERLGAQIEDFGFVPVLSDRADDPDDGWSGEEGFVHEAVDRYLADVDAEAASLKVYIAGPQVMVDATCDMLRRRHGIGPDRVAFDAFVPLTDH